MRILLCLLLLPVLASCSARREIKDFRHFPTVRKDIKNTMPASGIQYIEDKGTLVHTNPKLAIPLPGAVLQMPANTPKP